MTLFEAYVAGFCVGMLASVVILTSVTTFIIIRSK